MTFLMRLPFRVEMWDHADQHVRWVVAASASVTVGHAALEAAIGAYPGQHVHATKCALVIREHVPKQTSCTARGRFLFDQTHPEEPALMLGGQESSMVISRIDKHREYTRCAMECLTQMVELPSGNAHDRQREMALEWIRRADAISRPLKPRKAAISRSA
jgi:hypothetical protein